MDESQDTDRSPPAVAPPGFPRVALMGARLAGVSAAGLIDHLFAELGAGRGGWVVTANLDILRRHVRDPQARAIYDGADLMVADGMPLVWASRVQGTPLPERVAGSSLVPVLFERAAREGRGVFLLGGDPEAAAAAVARLARELPALRLCGQLAPRLSSPPTPGELAPLRDALSAARPDLVLVAFGSPKQEQVIQALRDSLPAAWWLGVGISLSFFAGKQRRAPAWMQRLGLEWVHRLAQEPRRLFRRYVVEDLPFAFRLFGEAARQRFAGAARREPGA